MSNDDFILSAQHVAELFRVLAVDHADRDGFLPLFAFRKHVAARTLAASDFAGFMHALRAASQAGEIPYTVEFRGPETPTEVATAGRLKPENRILFWNGQRQAPVMRVKIVDQLSDRLYDPYVNVTWDDVENGDEIYIDNYQRGKFPKASPQISGPFIHQVSSVGSFIQL